MENEIVVFVCILGSLIQLPQDEIVDFTTKFKLARHISLRLNFFEAKFLVEFMEDFVSRYGGRPVSVACEDLQFQIDWRRDQIQK